ncbi:MAG: PilZ domain-containing protein [Bdellovibrionota bacterium]
MDANPQSSSGYRHKPIWIQVIALGLAIAPIGNLAFTFFALGLPFVSSHSWIYWIHYVKPPIWAINVLLFASGILLMKVRTWTHLLAGVSLAVVMIYNIIFWKGYLLLGPTLFILMILISAATAALLYSRQFRKPYFNPRLRWWETKPRYHAKLRVSLSPENTDTPLDGEVLDISRSGLFVVLDTERDVGIGTKTTISLPSNIQLQGEVARRAQSGYGVRFVDVNWSQRQKIKEFVNQLASNPDSLLR